MIGLVINKDKDPFEWGWESFAIRVGLTLFDHACCIGSSPHNIMYEVMMEQALPTAKLKLLISAENNPQMKQTLQQAQLLMGQLKKQKHLKKEHIIYMKRTEALVHKLFEDYKAIMIAFMKKYGLMQLKSFYTDKDRSLYLWNTKPEEGESGPNGRYSEVLSQQMDEDPDKSPHIHIFYEALGKELLDTLQPTPLANVPNLSILEPEKLRNMRNRLKPMRQQFAQLLPSLPPAEDGTGYYTGYWNLEGIKAYSSELQQTLDATPELEWARNAHADFSAQLHIGNIDTPKLWQILYDKGLVPDDTWNALQQLVASGNHCPTSAFMTVTSNWGSDELTNLTEEETLVHKRKTINLD